MEKKICLENYAERFVEAVRILPCDDNKRHMVFVGNPQQDFSFLDSERYVAETFSSYDDCTAAIALVRKVLELIDEYEAFWYGADAARNEIADANNT